MIDPFYPSEKIIGKFANAYRRDYKFDEDIFNIVDRNRNFLREYLLWVDKTKNLEDSKNATKNFIEKWNNKENFAYVITDKSDKPVGSIDIQEIDLLNRSVKFGYFLGKEATGNGYVSDILKELEDFLFEKGFVRLQIECAKDNLPSNAVAVRNGYKLEGTHEKALNIYEIFHDKNIYAKIR